MITLDIQPDGSAWTHFRGGAIQHVTERDALEFVVRRQTERPGLTVKVIVR